MRLLKFVLIVSTAGVFVTGKCFCSQLIPSNGIFDDPLCTTTDWQEWRSVLTDEFSHFSLAKYIELPSVGSPVAFSVREEDGEYEILLNVLSGPLSERHINKLQNERYRVVIPERVATRFHEYWVAAISGVRYPEFKESRNPILDESECLFSAYADRFGYISGRIDIQGVDKHADRLLVLARRTIEIVQSDFSDESKISLLDVALDEMGEG